MLRRSFWKFCRSLPSPLLGLIPRFSFCRVSRTLRTCSSQRTAKSHAVAQRGSRSYRLGRSAPAETA